MPKTISFHNGSNWSRGHNIRDERYTSKQEHIDKSLADQNVTVRDMPVRQAYAEIFGQAVEEYNVRQKRSDRRITDYYDKIKRDKLKHPVYECIVQIGDRSDTGNSAELEKQALIRFAEEWDKRNPNLHLIGAYIHCDEPDGTVHMHCDYIPVAECTRGMRLQNSLDRALQQQGFRSENIHQTAQMAWQDSEREALCAICRDLGIDAQRDQGLSDRVHLSKREYIRAKEEQQAQIEDELKPLKEELDEITKKKVKLTEIDSVETKKSLFGGKVTVSQEDWESVTALAKKEVTREKRVKALKKERDVAVQERDAAIQERDELEDKLSAVSSELLQYKQREEKKGLMSRDKLRGESEKVKLRREIDDLRRKLSVCEEIIDEYGLSSELKSRTAPHRNSQSLD